MPDRSKYYFFAFGTCLAAAVALCFCFACFYAACYPKLAGLSVASLGPFANHVGGSLVLAEPQKNRFLYTAAACPLGKPELADDLWTYPMAMLHFQWGDARFSLFNASIGEIGKRTRVGSNFLKPGMQ